MPSNLKCCCGGNAQILKVYADTAYVAKEIGAAGAKVLWVCLQCGNLVHSYATLPEIAGNEKILGRLCDPKRDSGRKQRYGNHRAALRLNAQIRRGDDAYSPPLPGTPKQCLLPRHRDTNGFVGRDQVIRVLCGIENGDLHALHTPRKRVPTRPIFRRDR